jgi:hypothetical protein
MALTPAALSAGLQSDWLVPQGGQHPMSAAESGDRFAGAVAGWFAAATAGAFPTATAAARRPQLAASATGAFQAGSAPLAGSQLAFGLMGYIAGQVFGPGVASPPAGVAAAQAAITAAFGDLDLSNQARAQQIAGAISALAPTSVVIFPPVISPPQPVT